MNTLLLPLLLAAASPQLHECGPAEMPFADQALFVAESAIAQADAPASPVLAVEPVDPDAAAPADAVAYAEPAAPADAAMPAEAAAPADPAAPADATVAISAGDVDAKDEGRCLTETGSRIEEEDGRDCKAQPGDSYDRDDIERSGAVDTADAIRKLSPSATIRR